MDFKVITKSMRRVFLWLGISVIIGIIAGFTGAYFHIATEYATKVRECSKWLIYLLPLGGVFIVFLYNFSGKPLNTNIVIESVKSKKKVSPLLAPFIFISATVSHLFGASVGREGAAIQIGGGVGGYVGRFLRLNENQMSVAIVCGMAAAFSAIFTTPVTAVIFALEVVTVGHFKYYQFAPAMLSSAVAYIITVFTGNHPLRFAVENTPEISIVTVIQVIVLGTLFALVSIIYVLSIEYTSKLSEKYIKNPYIKIIIGGLIVIGLTLLVGDTTYNGTGMEYIKAVINGQKVFPWDFMMKIVFTAICIAVGFKGGEIVPAMFVGVTFGAFVAPIIGLNSSFGACIGLICVFCGITNCPIAALIMGMELFGDISPVLMGIAVTISYAFSGRGGLYSSQRMIYSKTHIRRIEP